MARQIRGKEQQAESGQPPASGTDKPVPPKTRTTCTRKRGRPRNPAHDKAILETARRILAEHGADALTFEAISQETGISRVSIYRRWPNKAHLLSEIANRSNVTLPDVIETEGLAGQLRAMITLLHQRYSQKDIGAAAIGVLGFWQKEPALRRELEGDQETDARAAFRKTIARGKALNMVREDVDSDTLFDLVVGSVMYGKLLSSLPEHGIDIDQITEILTRGAEPR